MKHLFSKPLFVFLFVNLTCYGYSQTFTTNELITLYRDNFDDFDTKVIKKGFEYIKSNPKANEEQISKYALNETEDDGFYTEVIKKIKFKSGITLLDYQVDTKDAYLKLKNQLKLLGYVSYKSKNQDGSTLFFYKSNKLNYKDIFIQIAVGIVDNAKGKTQAVYEISFHNNSKM